MRDRTQRKTGLSDDLLGRRVAGGARMMCSGNIARRIVTTPWAVVITLCLLALVVPAHGQAPDADPLPDTGASVDACLRMQSWLRQFDVPAENHPDAQVEIDQCSGICATLRWRGRITGTGVATSAQEAGLDDPPMMLHRAARRAFSSSLAHPTVTAVRDGERTDIDELLGNRLTLEFEAAGPLIPIAGRRWDQVAARLVPGMDGIALRAGNQLVMRFPSEMLATNMAGRMHRVLLALAHDLGLPARELDELRARHGLSVYRFRTLHFAERTPGASMRPLTRGQRVVPLAEVTPERVHDALDQLADHVVGRLHVIEDAPRMLGDYSIMADAYDDMPATHPHQALVAYALVRAASAPGLPTNRPDQLRATAESLIASSAAVLDDSTAAAWLVLATADLLDHGASEELAAILAEATAVLSTASNDTVGLTRHDRSVHAAAWARLLRHGAPEATEADVRRILDALWDDADPSRDVELLPWIGWAEIDFARATTAPLAQTDRLEALQLALDAARIRLNDAPDLAGGFALRSDRRTLADAQSLRPMAFGASALRLVPLTPADQARVRGALHRQSLRFLLQLIVENDELWAVQAPSRAVGGVRAASWSPDLPLAAQALALLVLAESATDAPIALQ